MVTCFAGNFAPRNWATCDGQILSISQNTALFSLLGTTYGGDGKSNFALPDLQGRVPMHPGQGPGLSLHDLGEQGGSETVTLLESEIPSHSHALRGSPDDADVRIPTAARTLAKSVMYASGAPNTPLADQALAPAGGDQPHNNMMPYLVLNFIIALQGIFPSQN